MDDLKAPRTTADMVFDHLYEEIVSLRLLPGTKMPEAEVAAQLGVSRQPVRDAFNRLSHLDLLSVRPQRATLVKGFSEAKIANARFVRLSVELEVLRHAHATWNDDKAEELDANLSIQKAAIDAGETNEFHLLDYAFHKLIFDLSDHALAFETVVACKQLVDRLCVLSLTDAAEVVRVYEDHQKIAAALASGPVSEVEKVLRQHLGRLDSTIADIQENHAEYFE